MKQGWERKKLGEVCTLVTDGDWIESKHQSGEGIRLIQTGNVGVGVFKAKKDRPHYISKETFDELGCTEIFPGDCLVSRLPDPVGRACIVPNLGFRMITAVDCSILRFKNIVLPDFFVYYTQCAVYQRDVNNNTTGTTRKRISRKNLESLPIPVPPLPIQERIVEELDCISGIIEKKKEQLKELDALAQSIFYTMFGDPVENDKGWEVKKLGEVCETTSGGTPSKTHKEYYDNGNIPWLRSGEVNKMFIDETELYITEEGLKNSSAKWIPVDTVVIAMYGATVGQVGILKKEMTTNQAICGIFTNNTFLPIYLYAFLLSMKEEFIKIASGGAQPNISQTIIKNTRVLCPPLPLQQEFAKKIEAIEKQKELIKASIGEVETLLASRMQEYFE